MRNILLILLFVIVLPFHAAENNFLVVYLHSGAKITFPIAEKPQMTFEGSILCVNTERYQISDVKKYTFSRNEEVSIQEVEGDNNKSFSFFDGEKIMVSVKDPSVAIRIYSSNGMEYAVKKESSTNGHIIIDMAGLMPDVYIVVVGDETIKIRKR